MKIFLSFSFNHGHDLTRAVERLLASHDVQPVTGRKLGGEAVDAAVEAKILRTDALISLVTKRPNPGPGESPWSQAVQEEYDFARGQKMRCIAVVEEGLAFVGMSNKERIKYDPANPVEAILGISETIAEWRQSIGQELKVQILPSTLAEKLENDPVFKCSHRYLDKDISTPWKEVQAITEEAGTFIYLRGVQTNHRVQLRVTGPQQNVTWQSPARVPWPMVQLKETSNG
jgi:hypothetical protein